MIRGAGRRPDSSALAGRGLRRICPTQPPVQPTFPKKRPGLKPCARFLEKRGKPGRINARRTPGGRKQAHLGTEGKPLSAPHRSKELRDRDREWSDRRSGGDGGGFVGRGCLWRVERQRVVFTVFRLKGLLRLVPARFRIRQTGDAHRNGARHRLDFRGLRAWRRSPRICEHSSRKHGQNDPDAKQHAGETESEKQRSSPLGPSRTQDEHYRHVRVPR